MQSFIHLTTLWLGPQIIMGIYVGYESPSIIKYLEPSIGDKLSFWWIKFSNIRGRYKELKKLENKISWNELSILVSDPRSSQCELEVKKIIIYKI